LRFAYGQLISTWTFNLQDFTRSKPNFSGYPNKKPETLSLFWRIALGLVEDAPPKTYQNMAVRHRKKNSSLPPRDLKKLEALRSLAEVRVKLGHGDCWKPQK